MMARNIVVTSGKGGVGKSSISVNLAISLALNNFDVCLIDADFGLKNLDVMLGLENRVVYDLKDVIDGRCSLDQVLIKDKRCSSLYLIPACKTLDFKSIDTSYMETIINHFQHRFDFIIIDSPAGIERGFDYACSFAQEAIVVVNLDLSSIRDNDRVIGLLMKKGINDIKMIINRVNIRNIEEDKSLSIEDARDILSIPLLGIVYESNDMIEANNKGVPISLQKSSILEKCFQNIAKRINGENVPYIKIKKKNLLHKIFSH